MSNLTTHMTFSILLGFSHLVFTFYACYSLYKLLKQKASKLTITAILWAITMVIVLSLQYKHRFALISTLWSLAICLILTIYISAFDREKTRYYVLLTVPGMGLGFALIDMLDVSNHEYYKTLIVIGITSSLSIIFIALIGFHLLHKTKGLRLALLVKHIVFLNALILLNVGIYLNLLFFLSQSIAFEISSGIFILLGSITIIIPPIISEVLRRRE